MAKKKGNIELPAPHGGIVITVCSNKGGVGKTTLVSNLACQLQKMGKKVLMLDLDPNGSLTFECGIDPSMYRPDTIVTLLNAGKKVSLSAIQNSIYGVFVSEGIHFIPGDLSLEAWEIEAHQSKEDQSVNLVYILDLVRDYYDYILIDTQPNHGLATQLAYVSTDYAVISTKVDPTSINTIKNVVENVEAVNSQYKRDTVILGVVPNIVDKNARREQRRRTELRYAYNTFSPIYADATVQPEAGAGKSRLPVSERRPNDRAALNFQTVALEILNRIKEEEEFKVKSTEAN